MVIVSVYTQAHDTYINGIVEEKRDYDTYINGIIVEEKRDKKITTIIDDFILVHG